MEITVCAMMCITFTGGGVQLVFIIDILNKYILLGSLREFCHFKDHHLLF